MWQLQWRIDWKTMRPFFSAWLLTITRGNSEIGMVSDICKKKHMVMVAGACFQLFDISSFILHTAAIGLQLLENSRLWQLSWQDNGWTWNTNQPRSLEVQPGSIICRIAGARNSSKPGQDAESFLQVNKLTNHGFCKTGGSISSYQPLRAASLSK